MKHTGKVQGAIAFVILAGYFLVLFVMLGKPDMRDAMLILIGALGGAVGSVIAFYFGSSSGSARKDELLANSSPMPTESVTVQQTTTTASQTNAEAKDGSN